MARRYLFADEAGNFDFSPKDSRYFILASVALDHCLVGDALTELRRDLAWRGVELRGQFRATEESQAVRDEVFACLRDYPFRVDATILEKAKAEPRVRRDETEFYRLAWYLHMKHVAPSVATERDELLVVGASLGTERKRVRFAEAMADVTQQVAPCPTVRTAFWPAASDPCLQVADYCCWAIQRKWERNDGRSYVLIEEKIRSEFDVFRYGKQRYY